MRNNSNLPPGCRESDIPGNSRDDMLWDSFIEEKMTPLLNDIEEWIHLHEDNAPAIQSMISIYERHSGEKWS